MRVTRADFSLYSGSVDWANVKNKPVIPSGDVDMSQVGGRGFAAGQIPIWNGTRFAPGSFPSTPTPTPGSTIADLDSPGVATRRQPPGLPYGATQDVWFREVFDAQQYGAQGDGSDCTVAVNRMIADATAQGYGTIFFPAGSYSMGAVDSIAVPVALCGEGVGLSVLRFTGNGLTATSQQFAAQNLSFVSDGSGGSDVGLTVSDGTSGSGEVTLDQLSFTGFWGIGVSLTGVSGYARSILSGSAAVGVELNYCNRFLVTDGIFENGTTGVLVTGTSEMCDVFDNLFETFSNAAVELASGVEKCRVYNHYEDCPDPPILGDGTVNYFGDLLPATATRLGTVRVGDGLTIDSDGVLATDGSGGGGGVCWIPLVTGAEPIEFVSNGAGQLILIPYTP